MTHPARRLWRLIEAINGVTYFAPRCRAAMDELGLKGFWMGYFASRAAPFGAVGPGLVEVVAAELETGVGRHDSCRVVGDGCDSADSTGHSRGLL